MEKYGSITIYGYVFALTKSTLLCNPQPLERASTYFTEQGIPFPKVELSDDEKKNLKECYVFEDTDNPEAPTVIYFPLVNDTFQRYLAPGKIMANSMEVKTFLAIKS